MSRLPTVGSDNNDWGNVLNDYLAVSLNTDGTIKKPSIESSLTGDIISHNHNTNNSIYQPITDNTLNTTSKTVPGSINELLTNKVDNVAGSRLITSTESTLLGNTSGANTGDETSTTIVTKIGDGSKISATYLPSYVDDVLEYANLAAFPGIGEQGKIYIAIDTNKNYRWSGSVYVDMTQASTLAFASQAEAETGTENTKIMTALRALQSIVYQIINYSFSGLNTTSKTIVGAINELLVNKANNQLLSQTFSGEFNLSSGGEVSYKIYSSNVALTPTVAASPIEDSFARVVVDAGASASLVTTNMGTLRAGSDTFTISKKNEIIMACLPDGTAGALVNYYSIRVLN